MSEISLVGITAVLFQRDAQLKWNIVDSSLCRLEILKSEKELKYRLVAISTDNRCIFNKWLRTNSSISKLSDVFLEIKQTSSHNAKTDSVGLNCAYKPETGRFIDVYNECVHSLQNRMSGSHLLYSGGVANGLTSSQSVTEVSFDSFNTAMAGNGPAGNIPNFLDLPLPPPPSSSSSSSSSSCPSSSSYGLILPNISEDNVSIATSMSLPPPPPPPRSTTSFLVDGAESTTPPPTSYPSPTFPSINSQQQPTRQHQHSHSLTGSTGISQPTPITKSQSNSFLSSSLGSTPPSSLDIFNPNKTITTTTTTTTTTVTRVGSGANTEAVIKTASGRRSIRARSNTDRKTLSKKEGLAISLQNVEGLQNIGENIEEESLNLLDLVNEQVVNQPSSVSLINQSINKLYEHLQILFILTAESGATHHGSKMVKAATEKLSRGPPSLNELSGVTGYNWYNIDEVGSNVSGFTNLLYAKKNLVPAIAHLSTSVRVLGLQASLEAEWMSRNQASEPDKVVVQLANLSRELLLAMARLQAATQSFCSVCTSIKANCEVISNPALRGRSPSTADMINIWDELRHIKDQLPTPANGIGLRATFNQLVLLLTSDSNYDSKFLKTFITTYQSFASPNLLFTKLVERYTVPDWYTTNKTKVTTIQQRIIVVLKYWIVNQSSDFDQDLVDQIYFFIDNTLISDGYTELSKALRDILNKLLEDRDVKLELLFQMPARIQFQEDSTLSPIELFYEWSAQSIAQQLTLIDFNIFKDIEARELLNQNFNQPKKKYRAPNVMRLINRSTQFSFWVATLIVMEGKKERRLKVFEKLLEIAKHLLKLNNFNTLMSLVAGLNLTPIHRLKKTKKKLSSSAVSMMAECERIYASKKSFKTYRDMIGQITAPCIPYIGINLTDMTFIDEGNPDLIPQEGTNNTILGPMINFKKRELFYQAWNDIARFQEQGYQFAPEEPLNTFLLHFPVLDEKDLYDLSTALEPR